MKLVRGRIHLTAWELEQVARCPRSSGYLETINRNRHCVRCEAFSETGRFILQRNFRGGNLPSVQGVKRFFSRALEKLGKPGEVTHKDVVMLHDLLVWGRGVAEDINLVGGVAESHLGLFTITDVIDAVLFDINSFSLVQFVCDGLHPERVMHYRAMHASLWLRSNYNVLTNDLMLVKMTDEGIQIHRFPVQISENILRESMEHILSNIDVPGSTESEKIQKMLELPTIYGEHCWRCMGCFPAEAADEQETA